MIVRNEAHVIRRCLDSVRPWVDCWVIVDTGSNDGTQQLIREHYADIPGELHERPWKDFGHNRSEALVLARDKADYTLIMDADDWIEAAPGFALPPLSADAYQFLFAGDGNTYWRPALVRSALNWTYVGVLHEYIECAAVHSKRKLPGLRVISQREGGRSQISPEAKYAADAALLEQALQKEPDNSRYVFYLAQSYRDCNQFDRSLQAYQRRVGMGGWDEEVWYSLLQIALLSERLEAGDALIVSRYLQAYQYRPRRAEPLRHLARYHRENGQRYALAHLFARQAVAIAQPQDLLFLDESVYAWRSLDEYAVACYWVGQHEEAVEAGRRLLATPALPDAQRTRVIENLNFSLRKLGLEEYRPDGRPS